MNPNAIIGVVLTLVAILLAVVMTVMNVYKTESDKEKRYVLLFCGLSWLIVAVSMLLVLILARPYKYIPLGVVIFVFPAAVYRFSLRHQLLREKNRREQERRDHDQEVETSAESE